VHDPASEVSVAIRDRGGYPLMPEWNTRARPTTTCRAAARDGAVHAEDLVRVDNPLKIDGKQPELPHHGAGREDYAT
jgi:hypothetical protein